MIKAQVLAGGRGKGMFAGTDLHGIVVAKSAERAKEISSQMIGSTLITKQTGSTGRPCNSVCIFILLLCAQD